jgi:hypothetical protein
MKLFAVQRDDVHQGWVWLQDATLPARSIVKITNPANGKSVYCEALQIDDNFLAKYNQPPRCFITEPKSALVMAEWFRARLGGIATQADVPLCIKAANNIWDHFRFCTGHPQVVVRLATWLGGIGLLLGVIGLLLGVVSVC